VGLGAGLVGCTSDPVDDVDDTGQVAQACYLDGNPSCADAAVILGIDLGTFSYKIEPPESGTYVFDGVSSFTMTTLDGVWLDWSATIGLDAVIVKGGPGANVWIYEPESMGETYLSAPINDSTGLPYAISHVELCYDYELAVTKTADASFTRSYQWTIDKLGGAAELVLAAGQVYPMPYQVSVSRAGYTDGDWAAAGTITIDNPAPLPATIVAIDDALDGVPVALACPFELPFELGALASATCTYEVALADPTDRTNTVTVLTEGFVGGDSASAPVSFAYASMTEVDACVDITDDHAGPLGTACDDVTYEYSVEIGPYAECDTTWQVVNTASFVAGDTSATGQDSWTVTVTVPPCDLGCTLTPGYWKTHSAYGPAPADDTWLELSDGPDTAFFLSGASYYQVLWTAPRGNAYYILAHAYIAAELNGLNGASLGAVAETMDDARDLFETWTPGQVDRNRERKRTFVALAATLDDYNNGLIGPGHCDE
jgi:hypothetical protein